MTIGFDEHFNRDPASHRPTYRSPALIDTGASISSIDAELAKALNLPVVNTVDISGVHGTAPQSVHLAQVGIPELGFVFNSRFAAARLSSGDLPFQALLGRDFLRFCDMHYKGPTGEVTVSRIHQPYLLTQVHSPLTGR